MKWSSKQLPLRVHLLLLTFVSVVPVLAFAAGLLVVLSSQQRQHLEAVLQSSTNALAAAVDQQIGSNVAVLKLFGEVDDFEPARLGRLHRRATRLVRMLPNWNSVILARANGRVLLDSSIPYGRPLSVVLGEEEFFQAMEKEQTTASIDRDNSVTFANRLISIIVPLRTTAGEKYALIGKIYVKSLSVILQEQNLDKDWTAAILDSDSRIIARSRSPETYFGMRATPKLAQRSHALASALFEDITQEGVRTYGSFKRLEARPWTVVLGLPAGLLDQPIQKTLLSLIIGGAFFLLMTLILAAFIGRRISRPIMRLSEVARALSRGERPSTIDSSISELTQVSEAMVAAAREKEKAEASLSASERRFRTLFQQAPFSAQLLGLDGRTLQVNFAWQNLWQTSTEVVENFVLKEYNILEDPQLKANGVTTFVQAAYAGESVVTDPIWYDPQKIGQPGRARCLLAYVHPIKDEQGKVAEVMLIHHDITNLKEAEEQLKVGKEAAESANKLKSAFLANMSHEIRTPLGAILGFTELVKESEFSEEERQRYLEIIERSGRSLMQIIDDILDLSRVEAGTLRIDKSLVKLADVVHETASLLQLKATKKGVKFKVEVDPNVPKYIETDATRLRQILINLIGNALKFTEKGEVSVKVEMCNSNFVVVVRDTGIGISPDRVHLLFQPFSQIDSSPQRKFGGTGLGLALSKKLANALGGDIEYQCSPDGQGSIFRLLLPLYEPLSLESAHRADLPASSALLPKDILKGLNILIVDDLAENRLLIERLLSKRSAVVRSAVDGVDALEKIEAHDFDVVLMDVQMPNMDGLQAVRRLREMGYTKPIIALTAFAMKEDVQRSEEAGFNSHLSKPISSSVLISTILEQVKSADTGDG